MQKNTHSRWGKTFHKQENYKKLRFAESKSIENSLETQELSDKSEEINADDKKIVAEIKPVSKTKTEVS